LPIDSCVFIALPSRQHSLINLTVMAKKEPTPNDQRSTVKNPTSPQYEADQSNQEKQRHENEQQNQPTEQPKKPKKD
jgi:hypothetical protein